MVHPIKEDAMKILIAGASGAIGAPVTRQLLARGHDVWGITRDPASAARLTALGARPVVVDALDRDGLLRAVDGLTIDAVVNELTALKKMPRRHSGMAMTDRLRTKGTANLVEAAEKLGSSRFVTQSFCFGYGYYDHGSAVLTEDAPFGVLAGNASDPHVAAMHATEEQAFTRPEGIALRYGLFYGGDAATMRDQLAKRAIPVTAGGALPWVHHEDAAAATVAAVEHGVAGAAYNIVDDLPVSAEQMFTAMAEGLHTHRPLHVPRVVYRIVAPFVASFIGASLRLSNAKAKRELGWSPEFPTYLDGIREMARTLAV
jgi:nucleoside-diphosphate-sugar epimerase